jgi:hypothetical protein
VQTPRKYLCKYFDRTLSSKYILAVGEAVTNNNAHIWYKRGELL